MRTFKIFILVFILSISTYSQNLVWSIKLISDRKTGYDYQSHGSAQQVWLDLNNPDNLHAVFIYSALLIMPGQIEPVFILAAQMQEKVGLR